VRWPGNDPRPDATAVRLSTTALTPVDGTPPRPSTVTDRGLPGNGNSPWHCVRAVPDSPDGLPVRVSQIRAGVAKGLYRPE